MKKIIVLLTSIFVLLSCTSCSDNKSLDTNATKINGNSINTSSEIYDFNIDLVGNLYTLPATLSEFKNTGWVYANNENPENKDITAKSWKTCDILKDGKKITLTVYNLGTSIKKFADCEVGSIDCTFSSVNDITLNLAKNLSITKNTEVKDVISKFGEPTKTINNEDGTTIRYQKDIYVYYNFDFNTGGKLTHVDIENWKGNDDNSPTSKANLSYLDEYKAPSALTDDYSDYIFRLEGKIYSLPVPVNVLVSDGWVFSNGQPKSIAGGQETSKGLTMKKGDNEVRFTIKNFATDPVEPKDTMITGVYLSSELVNNLDFELSGGIMFGMSFADFESKPFFNQFTSETAIFGDIQYSHFEPSNQVYLEFKDDKLISANFSKHTLNK